MAMFHVAVDRIVKGTTAGGATGFAQYIAREDPDRATQHLRYLTRASHPAKDDLVAAGAAHLPGWARDATHFFTLADQYERQGGIVTRTYEIALPRELTPAQRQDLADDLRATFFAHHPHAWAIHNPVARDGGEQPHVHLMVSERRIDGLDRTPQAFFRRAAPQRQDPATGGARKDPLWKQRTTVPALREGIATLTNAALERAGHPVAVSGATLAARGFDRTPEQDQGGKARFLHATHGIDTPGWQATLAQRATLQRDYHPWENETNRAAWYAQKQREGIRDVSRAAMVEHVRAQFWAHDVSPARAQERTDAVLNQVGRALQQAQQAQQTGLPQHPAAPTRERASDQDTAPGRTPPDRPAPRQLGGGTRTSAPTAPSLRPPTPAAPPRPLRLVLDGDDTPAGGVHVRLRDHEPTLDHDWGIDR